MNCSECGRKAYVRMVHINDQHQVEAETLTVKEDKYLGAVCSDCSGQYATIKRRNKIMITGFYSHPVKQ